MKTKLTIFVLMLLALSSCSKSFKQIDVKTLKDNPVSLFADDWMVVTAGTSTDYNLMTISWGALGNLWGYPTATIYVRDSRNTFTYMNRERYFTLCAFGEECRDKLKVIGSKSGRDIDKVKATGLTPLYTDLGNVYYKEARLVLECEKVYFDDFAPNNFLDPAVVKIYNNEPSLHRVFVGKILNVWVK
ncbi:MAG: flavin reductase [Paludibacter sp.]|jgi:flavin reductase (DIM6/NTAB) family NADH-FMN oxidoreductase RutF|nr:flavin reductase [Paludibacter sp.]